MRVVFDQAGIDAVLIGAAKERGETHTEPTRTYDFADRIDDFAQKAQAVGAA
jgi:hypothetical protein